MPDDIYNIILKIQGEADARRLTETLKVQERQLLQNIALNGQHAASTIRAAEAYRQTASALRAAESSAGRAGQSLNQIGFAVDDLQYGFKGISNNIQPVLMSIPSLAKFAGPISIAAIATYQLYTHWDQLMDLMGLGLPQPALTGAEALAQGLKKAQDEADELGKKAKLTWYELAKLKSLKVEIADLKKATKDAEELESVLGGRSEREKSVGDGFKKALDESGGQNAVDELSSALGDGADAKGLVFNPVTRTMTEPDKAAKDLTLAATRGDEMARAEIVKVLKPGSRFAAEIEKNSPEAKEKQDRADAVADSEQEAFDANLENGKSRKQREQAEARKVAGDILKGKAGDKFLTGTGTDEDITAELGRMGLRTDDPLLRKRVRSQVDEQSREMGAAEATEKGLADPLAGGKSLVEERQKKRKDDAARELKDRVDAAKQANPELARAAAESIKGMVQIGGLDLGDAKANIVGGLKAKLGEDVARSLVDDAGVSAGKAIGDEAINARPKDLGPSRVIQGASGLRDSLQGAVKSPELDVLKKQLQETLNANQILRRIADKEGGLG